MNAPSRPLHPDRPGAVAALVPEVGARAAQGGGHALAVRRMFDRISPTYDLLNRTLSLGIDRGWRRRALDRLAERMPDGPVLDLCAGTLDLAREVQTRFPGRRLVAGDFAREMLLAGRAKLAPGAQLSVCDAMQLPFARGAFAGVVCGFGVRNLADPVRGLAEAHRVLADGGALVVLEFFRPENPLTRLFHAGYGSVLLPLVGRLVSGDGEAYGYLSRSMRGFLTRGELEQAMREIGFRDIGGQSLSFGIASLVWGVK
jgi:ubiquinone/menaquinone biosynthesis methyltransferase